MPHAVALQTVEVFYGSSSPVPVHASLAMWGGSLYYTYIASWGGSRLRSALGSAWLHCGDTGLSSSLRCFSRLAADGGLMDMKRLYRFRIFIRTCRARSDPRACALDSVGVSETQCGLGVAFR